MNKGDAQDLDTLSKIEECLREKGWSSSELARRLGISVNTMTDWKSGRHKSYLRHINRIAELLDTTPAYLLGATDDPGAENRAPLDEATQKVVDLLISRGVVKDGKIDQELFDYLDAALTLVEKNRK